MNFTTLLAALAEKICRMAPTGFACVDVVIQRCMVRFLSTGNSRVVRFSLPKKRRTGLSPSKNSPHLKGESHCHTINARSPISSSQTDNETVVTRGLR